MKITHEIRDPIHSFIKMTSDERRVLDSSEFQRLRHIHQLATSYLIYPSATHKRFEHSLGVMELAGRVYDIVTNAEFVHNKIKDSIPEINEEDKLKYWRAVLRMAALCHDLGHLPFSHAAEKELLPVGYDHEQLTLKLIDNLNEVWQEMTPPLRNIDIKKLAVGPEKLNEEFTVWEAILAEIITGDAFGVDRMDYLLRDSYHVGVAYGKFDHFRLIDTLRILPKIYDDTEEPTLGVEEGGLHSSEALLLARYFMFSQVYFHDIRRIYDLHLKEFLQNWLPKGYFSMDVEEHQSITDNEVLAAIRKAAKDKSYKSHEYARIIHERDHYKILYKKTMADLKLNTSPGSVIYENACSKFGNRYVRHDEYTQKGGTLDFPVICKDGKILSSLSMSSTLNNIPVVSIDNVYIAREVEEKAKSWLSDNKDDILSGGEI